MELTANNMSIDILTAVIFSVAIWRGVVALYLNHLDLRDKIYIGLFTFAAVLYVYQTLMQVQTDMSSNPEIWNIVNGIHAFLALSIITLLSKKSTHEHNTTTN